MPSTSGRFDTVLHECDGQTDKSMNMIAIAYTMASHGKKSSGVNLYGH